MGNLTKEEFVHILRRQSTSFSRGNRALGLQKCGRWDARMCQFLGKKLDSDQELCLYTPWLNSYWLIVLWESGQYSCRLIRCPFSHDTLIQGPWQRSYAVQQPRISGQIRAQWLWGWCCFGSLRWRYWWGLFSGFMNKADRSASWTCFTEKQSCVTVSSILQAVEAMTLISTSEWLHLQAIQRGSKLQDIIALRHPEENYWWYVIVDQSYRFSNSLVNSHVSVLQILRGVG